MTSPASHKPQSLRFLVLSPHRGDAAFSLALSIAAWLREGHAVTILNVFTRSLNAPFSDADFVHENDRLSYVSAMRRKEDEDFLKQIPGATMIDVNIKDAPLRLHCSPDVVLDMPVDPNDGAFPKIQKAITRHIGDPNTVVVLPLALGHDVDHRVVRDATLPLTGVLPIAFYEDLPYAAGDSVTDQLQAEVGPAFHQHLTPVICPHTGTVAWKRKAALLYASQINEETADLIDESANRYHGNERLWANDAFVHLVRTSPAAAGREPHSGTGNAATI